MKSSTFGLVSVQKWNRQRAVVITLGVRDHRSHILEQSHARRKTGKRYFNPNLCRCSVQTTEVSLQANSPFRGVQRSHKWAARQPGMPYVARRLHRGAGHFFSSLYNRRK